MHPRCAGIAHHDLGSEHAPLDFPRAPGFSRLRPAAAAGGGADGGIMGSRLRASKRKLASVAVTVHEARSLPRATGSVLVRAVLNVPGSASREQSTRPAASKSRPRWSSRNVFDFSVPPPRARGEAGPDWTHADGDILLRVCCVEEDLMGGASAEREIGDVRARAAGERLPI